MTTRSFDRDLGSRVACADDEDATVPKLGRIPVLGGMHLDDGRIELGCEGRDPGALIDARRHHHVGGLEPVVASRHDVSVALFGEAVHANPRSNGETESRRVGLEVVGHLVLRRERSGRSGKGPPRETVIPSLSEYSKGVPPFAPGIADPLARIQDHERSIPLRQVVPHGETGLPATDDDRLEPLRAIHAVHRFPPDAVLVKEGRSGRVGNASGELSKSENPRRG